jgi:hypothetical protein
MARMIFTSPRHLHDFLVTNDNLVGLVTGLYPIVSCFTLLDLLVFVVCFLLSYARFGPGGGMSFSLGCFFQLF